MRLLEDCQIVVVVFQLFPRPGNCCVCEGTLLAGGDDGSDSGYFILNVAITHSKRNNYVHVAGPRYFHFHFQSEIHRDTFAVGIVNGRHDTQWNGCIYFPRFQTFLFDLFTLCASYF